MQEIFDNLFVLELANNHWGKLDRGLEIVEKFSNVIKKNDVKAAIKLQFRDVDNFIHKEFRNRTDLRYIKKTLATKMDFEKYRVLVSAIKDSSCLTMATPFDEVSVDKCIEFGIDIIKIASSDINDKVLINKILLARKPVIVSTGGSNLDDIDNIVNLFENKSIPLAINHCVSQYPTEKHNLDLNQISFLKNRYPNNVIGFSTHETNEGLGLSIMLAYASGARTFERHIDIDKDNIPVSPYCSLPEDIDNWIKSYKLALKICGDFENTRRYISIDETKYLDALVRGLYAKKDLKKGEKLSNENVYFAIPLQKGQISCREFTGNEIVLSPIKADSPILINDIDSEYSKNEKLNKLIQNRGL